MKLICVLVAFLLNSTPVWGDKPEVIELGEGKYKLGQVTFDENTRRISFPAEINQQEGIIEYAIVHEKGKIHESLLITTTSAFHLNVALQLLRYQSSPELFPILNDDFESTGKYPQVPEAQKTASRLQVLVSWEIDGKKEEASLNDLIYHVGNESAMEPLPWIYQGSYIHENSFKAETSGDLAAIYITRSSLINFSGKDNEMDEPWIPNRKRIPPVTTPVTVTFAPLLEKK
ncbi:MAG: YdjY domain-containing protein [Roseibacillus sp.]